MAIRTLHRRMRRRFPFLGDRGTATVEFVIWMPLFAIILAITADACMLYLMQADMWNVARDTARRMSTGELNAGTAQTYAASELLYANKPYTITASVGATDTLEISIPVQNASIFGVLGVLGSFSTASLDAKAEMRAEQ